MALTKKVIPKSTLNSPLIPQGLLAERDLHGVGNTDLLEMNGIGICGSRDASPEALLYAYKFGREAARRGYVVVSGYARGIDRQAHNGALEEGGQSIAVLAEGIESFRIVKELADAVNQQNFLAISMFDPQARWTAWRAMERNKLIVGLSVGLFVVEAREKGGTINAAMECMKQRKPLWAIAYSTSSAGRKGNQKILQESAIPLRHLRDVQQALDDAKSYRPVQVSQLAFDLVKSD